MYTNIFPMSGAVEAFTIAAAHSQSGTKCKLYKSGGVWYVAI